MGRHAPAAPADQVRGVRDRLQPDGRRARCPRARDLRWRCGRVRLGRHARRECVWEREVGGGGFRPEGHGEDELGHLGYKGEEKGY